MCLRMAWGQDNIKPLLLFTFLYMNNSSQHLTIVQFQNVTKGETFIDWLLKAFLSNEINSYFVNKCGTTTWMPP